MTDLRINARLDEESAEDLRYLRHELGEMSTTDVLKYSLRRVAQEFRDRDRAKQQRTVWSESGFIGAFDGPEDLSGDYKRYLSEIMDEKK